MESTEQWSSIMNALRDMQEKQEFLLAAFASLNGNANGPTAPAVPSSKAQLASGLDSEPVNDPDADHSAADSSIDPGTTLQAPSPPSPTQRPGFTSRIILTLVKP